MPPFQANRTRETDSLSDDDLLIVDIRLQIPGEALRVALCNGVQ